MVAMIRSCCESAVRPSHRPVNCQLLTSLPLLEYWTMQLCVFPLAAGSPLGPTPFCHETKIEPSNEVMSSAALKAVPPVANTDVVNPFAGASSLAIAVPAVARKPTAPRAPTPVNAIRRVTGNRISFSSLTTAWSHTRHTPVDRATVVSHTLMPPRKWRAKPGVSVGR